MRTDLTRWINRAVPRTDLDEAERIRCALLRLSISPIVRSEPGGVRGTADRPGLTEVLHEVWVRLERTQQWSNRSHFLAAAARSARQVLVDAARRRRRRIRTTSSDLDVVAERDPTDCQTLRLHAALNALERVDAASARVAGLKLFGDLPAAVIATEEGCCIRTVERHWRFARAWILNWLGEQSHL